MKMRRLDLGALGMLALPLLLSTSCGFQGECDCIPGGVTVSVPAEVTATELRLSGEACDGAEVTCGGSRIADAANLCDQEQHYVHPVGPGPCHIEVDLDGQPTFITDVEIYRQDGDCCPGLYAEGGWLVTVE